MLSEIIKTFEDRAILEGAGTMNKNKSLQVNEVAINDSSLARWKKTQYGGYLSHFRCSSNTKGVLLIHRNILVGAVNVERHPNDGLTWIQALEVNGQYQQQGFGSRLVQKAVSLGATDLSVDKNNKEAIHMYLKNGFKAYKDTGNQYFMSTRTSASDIKISDPIKKSSAAAPVTEFTEANSKILTETVETTATGDTVINLQNFESGLFNFILVIGLPGSGKGCIGREIAKKYGAVHLELDVFDQCGNMSDVEIRRAGEPFATYILDTPDGQWYRKNAHTLSLNEKLQGNHDFIIYAIGYAKAHKDKIFVLDGTPIYAAMEPEEIRNYPLVMKGTDARQSFDNKVGRDAGKGSSDKLHSNVSGAYLDGLLNYYWNDWDYLKKFTDEVADQAEDNVNFHKAGTIEESAVASVTDDEVIRICKELNNKLNSFGYGALVNGHIEDLQGIDFANAYRTLSCKEFAKYKGGVCWDYARYQKNYLTHCGIPAENYYIELHDAMSSTHTFTIVKSDGRYIYLESSFQKIQGVYESSDLNSIISFILLSMKCDRNRKYDIRKFKDPKSGLTTLEYMDYVINHGQPVSIHYVNTEIIHHDDMNEISKK